MRDNYKYLDSDYTYTDPNTGLLRNIVNIDNEQLLTAFESMKCSERLEELSKNPIKIKNSTSLLDIHNSKNPIKIKNSTSLLDIHKYLFQDVYHWAGQKRTVEISKQGKQFFLTAYFDKGFEYIEKLLVEYRKVEPENKSKIAEYLANLLDSINYLHPFREGNGRTQREYIRTLALEKGYILILNPPDNTDIFERYMSGTIDGDVEKLTKLINELLV